MFIEAMRAFKAIESLNAISAETIIERIVESFYRTLNASEQFDNTFLNVIACFEAMRVKRETSKIESDFLGAFNANFYKNQEMIFDSRNVLSRESVLAIFPNSVAYAESLKAATPISLLATAIESDDFLLFLLNALKAFARVYALRQSDLLERFQRNSAENAVSRPLIDALLWRNFVVGGAANAQSVALQFGDAEFAAGLDRVTPFHDCRFGALPSAERLPPIFRTFAFDRGDGAVIGNYDWLSEMKAAARRDGLGDALASLATRRLEASAENALDRLALCFIGALTTTALRKFVILRQLLQSVYVCSCEDIGIEALFDERPAGQVFAHLFPEADSEVFSAESFPFTLAGRLARAPAAASILHFAALAVRPSGEERPRERREQLERACEALDERARSLQTTPATETRREFHFELCAALLIGLRLKGGEELTARAAQLLLQEIAIGNLPLEVESALLFASKISEESLRAALLAPLLGRITEPSEIREAQSLSAKLFPNAFAERLMAEVHLAARGNATRALTFEEEKRPLEWLLGKETNAAAVIDHVIDIFIGVLQRQDGQRAYECYAKLVSAAFLELRLANFHRPTGAALPSELRAAIERKVCWDAFVEGIAACALLRQTVGASLNGGQSGRQKAIGAELQAQKACECLFNALFAAHPRTFQRYSLISDSMIAESETRNALKSVFFEQFSAALFERLSAMQTTEEGSAFSAQITLKVSAEVSTGEYCLSEFLSEKSREHFVQKLAAVSLGNVFIFEQLIRVDFVSPIGNA